MSAIREASRGTVVAIVVIFLILAAGGVIWIVNVATSGVRGQGDAVIKKNSADNWTKQQAEFERLYASIKAQDKNIGIAHAELRADPTNQVKQTNYSGQIRNCNDTVGAYNAKAREYLAEDFRAADLPDQIDQTDPATDCKEN